MVYIQGSNYAGDTDVMAGVITALLSCICLLVETLAMQ